jgi:eukaryotic-like serine/threonine-protein kinase
LIRLGDVALERPIGRGGMGAVWLGIHTPSSMPVAVKIATGQAAQRDAVREAFDREVRMVASLDHPAVVRVLDYGVLPEQTEQADEALEPGSPYLVMEYAQGGTLGRNRGKPRPWPALHALLTALLAGLAHAHARGVVHRDLKPANVLVRRDGSLAIADFGIAWSLHDPGDTTGIAGTPAYMAPEQILGGGMQGGPWTDLYALGCMVWSLTTGAPPFSGDARAVLRQHLREAPGHYRPRMSVPPALEGWVRRLLAKTPEGRFRRAADAAWTLPTGTETQPQVWPTRPRPKSEPTGAADQPTVLAADLSTRVSTKLAEQPTRVLQPADAPDPARRDPQNQGYRRPPVPDTWRSDAGPSSVAAAIGLGIHSIRRHRLVGREDERDRLWESLKQAARGVPAVVRIRGGAGVGKSALARWLTERAHEVGAATILTVHCRADGGSGDGLRTMLHRHLRVGPEEAARAARAEWARLGGTTPDGDALAAAAAGVLRADAEARAILRYLGALSTCRTVLLWVDDCQWADAATEILVREAADGDARLLVVCTERSDLSPARDEGFIALGPLENSEHAHLVRSLLGLAPSVGQMVAERTQGQPLFAVHLVSDWVERGWLVPDSDGFRLREGVTPTVPAQIHALWAARIERLDAGDDRLLEVAAILGDGSPVDLLRATAGRLGLAMTAACLDRCARAELLWVQSGTIRLAHGMLSEALVEHAQEEGRAVKFHAAAAGELEDRDGDSGLIGRHRMGAGDPVGALPFLLQAVFNARSRADRQAWSVLLDACDSALSIGGRPASHPDVGNVAHAHLQIGFLTGQVHAGDLRLDALITKAERHGWRSVEARTHWLRHCAWRAAGVIDRARADLLHCRKLGERYGLAETAALVALDSGILARISGDYEEAGAHFREVIAIALPRQQHLRHQAQLRLAALLARTGEPEAALAGLVALYEAWDDSVALAARLSLYNELGTTWAQIDPPKALPWLRKALDLAAAYGHVDTPVARFNLAETLLDLGRISEARPHLVQLQAHTHDFLGPGVHQLLAWTALLDGDVPGAKRELGEAVRLAATMSRADVAIGTMGPRLLAFARRLKEPAIEAAVYTLSRGALGDRSGDDL